MWTPNVKKIHESSFVCSDGWRTTGYFTPVETEYSSSGSTQVDVKGVGTVTLNTEFVSIVFNEEKGFGEGWGKTRFGWYVGKYAGEWHKSSAPLDAHDSPLTPNSVAVDPSLIPKYSVVRIPDLPRPFADIDFVSTDVGVTVHGKHIDIYTGEGLKAAKMMYAVTFEDPAELQRVCFATP
jgi:3D (Asp-Asp-Asp) domain-containing protein